MVKPRMIETDQGITGEFNTKTYDEMMRRMRDRGWLETKMIITAGLSSGLALEVGPGPGYLGLEWLKHTQGTALSGLDISEDMIAVAERNAREYGLIRCLLKASISMQSSAMALYMNGRIQKRS